MRNTLIAMTAGVMVAAMGAGDRTLAAIASQQQSQGRGDGRGQGQGRGQGGGGVQLPAPLNIEDRTGFESIFDGTLKNWDGDPAVWKVENGAIVGQTTADNPSRQNTFLIWRGGEYADIELKAQFRINAGNSGIYFRSFSREGRGNADLAGYQADIDFDGEYVGMFYQDGERRGFIAPRGTAGYVGSDGAKKTIGHLERNPDELKRVIKPGAWNDAHVIARGNVLVFIVNGHVTSLFIDDEVKDRRTKGLIGLQVHVGPPMKVEFRNIYLKKL